MDFLQACWSLAPPKMSLPSTLIETTRVPGWCTHNSQKGHQLAMLQKGREHQPFFLKDLTG